MKNVYDGVATLDKRGEATVELWDWFEEVNTDLRYQLTPIGAPAHGLHVSREVAGNQFKTAGGIPGLEVSWQVTGVRRVDVCRSCGMSLTVEVSAIHPLPSVRGSALASSSRINMLRMSTCVVSS